MDATIGLFITDLKLAGRQPLTLEAHEQELKRLAAWLNQQGLQWRELDKRQLQTYARTKADLAASTRANAFTTWRVFFSWAVEQGEIAMSPAVGFRTPTRPKPLPQALSRDQVRRLLGYLRVCEGLTARRDEALVLTGLYAGLRAAELAALRWPAIDFAGSVINIRLSKMNHGRSVPLHSELCSVLENWRELQALDDQVPVFSLDGAAISPARPGKIVRRLGREAGVACHTHSLRHTFATWMLRQSGNLYAVSKALGHQQLKQTEVYLSADVESTREAIETLPSIENW